MDKQPENIADAIVTDPPYAVYEYDGSEIDKMRNGHGGLWRIPPRAFGGHERKALPRFSVINDDPEARNIFSNFFTSWGKRALRILKPGGHLIIASTQLHLPNHNIPSPQPNTKGPLMENITAYTPQACVEHLLSREFIKPEGYDHLLNTFLPDMKSETRMVACIFGLKGTGKKTWMRHAVAEVPDAILFQTNSASMNDVYAAIRHYMNQGKKYFFIENFTDIWDCLSNSRDLYKVYTEMGAKIVLSGDSTYTIHLLSLSSLACLLSMYPTQHIYTAIDNTEEYIKEAIVKNIATAIYNRQYDEYLPEFSYAMTYFESNTLNDRVQDYLFRHDCGDDENTEAMKEILKACGVLKESRGVVSCMYPELACRIHPLFAKR